MAVQETKEKCAHKGCSCQVIPSQGVHMNNKLYCSQECADGKGCHHSNCTCGT